VDEIIPGGEATIRKGGDMVAKKKKTKVPLFDLISERVALFVGILFGLFIAFTGSGALGSFLPWVIGEGVLIIALTVAAVYLTRKSKPLAVLLIFGTLFFIVFVSWPHFLSDIGLLQGWMNNPILVVVTACIILPFPFLFACRFGSGK
jgi:hypothetical protein